MSTPVVVDQSEIVCTADRALAPNTQRRIADGVADNTRRAYSRIAREYVAWCEDNRRTAIPATGETLADYISALADRGSGPAARGIESGTLLRTIDRHGNIGGAMSPAAINDVVQRLAQRAGLQDATRYSAHSLRAGGATVAYKNGAGVSTIASHGRWAPNSPVVLGYIRSVDRWRDNPMAGVGL